MEQINIGAQENGSASTYDICVLCDYKPPNYFEKKKDVCTCCDATDWFKKDA